MMGYIWNRLDRLSGGRAEQLRNVRPHPLDCPKCERMGTYHLYAEPKYRFCDAQDCGWRSCPVCKISWSLWSGKTIPFYRPPTKAA